MQDYDVPYQLCTAHPPSNSEVDSFTSFTVPPAKRKRTDLNADDNITSDNVWELPVVQPWFHPVTDRSDTNTRRDGMKNVGFDIPLTPSSPPNDLLNSFKIPMSRVPRRSIRSPISPLTPRTPTKQDFPKQTSLVAQRPRRCSAPALVKSFSPPLEDWKTKQAREEEFKPTFGACEFIDDTKPFPKEQQWVRPTPPPPRPVIDVAALNAMSSSPAPAPGESLSLQKHADRIAALIEQKRKANERTSFRQKLLRKQLACRGVPDAQDKILAVSHDRLKRRMEASAHGIMDDSEEPSQDSDESASSLPEIPSSPTRFVDFGTPLEQIQSTPPETEDESDHSHEDQMVIEPLSIQLLRMKQRPSMPSTRSLSVSSLPHTIQSISDFHSTTTSDPVLSVDSQRASYNQSTGSLPQTTYQQDLDSGTVNYGQRESIAAFSQTWSRQLRQALPGTELPDVMSQQMQLGADYPVPEARLTTTSDPMVNGSALAYAKTHHTNLFDLGRQTMTNDNFQSSSTLSRPESNVSPTRSLFRPPVLGSNMNMFTGHARESFFGVSNSSSNTPVRSTRKNMFRS